MGRELKITADMAKRPDETWGQWKARTIVIAQALRIPGEPLVTAETERHGDYRDCPITHVETNTRAVTKRNLATSGVAAIYQSGGIDEVQYQAAQEIAQVAEAIERAVSIRCASIEARVDNSGSGRDFIRERLHIVRMEQAYTRWRMMLPMPKRLVIDMVLTERALVATARVHGVPWRKARNYLIDALDRWEEVKGHVWRCVDTDDVLRVEQRIEGFNPGLALQRKRA